MCRPTRRGAGPFRGNPNRPLRPIDPLRERATPESVHTYLVQETNVDHQGRSPRVRPFHCTPVGLTFAIAPNVGDSGTLFLSVGSCVRARPRQKRKPKNRSIFLRTQPGFTSSPPTKRSSSLPEFNLAPSPPTGRSSSRQDPNLASNPPTGRSSSRQGLNLQPGFISAGGALVNAPGPQPGFITGRHSARRHVIAPTAQPGFTSAHGALGIAPRPQPCSVHDGRALFIAPSGGMVSLVPPGFIPAGRPLFIASGPQPGLIPADGALFIASGPQPGLIPADVALGPRPGRKSALHRIALGPRPGPIPADRALVVAPSCVVVSSALPGQVG